MATTPTKKPDAPPPPPAYASKQDADAARVAIAKLGKISGILTKALMGVGGGALIFTCVNVTRFAAGHHTWVGVAWLLDPMVSFALLIVLYVDGVLAELSDKRRKRWALMLRWFAGLATWVMNCWQSLYPTRFAFVPQHPDVAGVVLHSVAPLLLIFLSEASTEYRKYVTEQIAGFRAVVQAAEDTARMERERREEHEQAEREREAQERREAARLEAQRQRHQDEIEREDRRDRERREAELQLEREKRAADIELAARQRQAELDAQREAAKLAREQAEIDEEAARRRARLEAEERDREAVREAGRIRAQAEADAITRKAESEARAREEQEQTRRIAAEQRAAGQRDAGRKATVKARPSTLIVNPSSTVNPVVSVDGKPEASLDGNPRSTVNAAPRHDRRVAGNPSDLRVGNVSDEQWIEIGLPVYEAVREEVGKRPPEGRFHGALSKRVDELVTTRQLQEVALNPSLATAKRVRGLVERRFPDVTPIHPVADAVAS